MRFSIITVVKNGYPKIKVTINSVLNQNFKNYEYIILDGGSKDKTEKFIKKFYKKKIIYKKKKDKGIYEALNRSVSKVKGDYIINLHAGDFFCSENTLKKIDQFLRKNSGYDFYFSNIAYYKNKKVSRLWRMPIYKIDSLSFLKIPHTSLCIKRKVAKKIKYKTNYKISSDICYLIEICKNYKGKYLDFYSVFMESGGLSTSFNSFYKKFKEDFSILFKEYNIFFFIFWIYKIIIKIPGYFLNKQGPNLEFLKIRKKLKLFY